jgi:hypothetical protein
MQVFAGTGTEDARNAASLSTGAVMPPDDLDHPPVWFTTLMAVAIIVTAIALWRWL